MLQRHAGGRPRTRSREPRHSEGQRPEIDRARPDPTGTAYSQYSANRGTRLTPVLSQRWRPVRGGAQSAAVTGSVEGTRKKRPTPTSKVSPSGRRNE